MKRVNNIISDSDEDLQSKLGSTQVRPRRSTLSHLNSKKATKARLTKKRATGSMISQDSMEEPSHGKDWKSRARQFQRRQLSCNSTTTTRDLSVTRASATPAASDSDGDHIPVARAITSEARCAIKTAQETLGSGCQTNSDMHKAVSFYCVPLQKKAEKPSYEAGRQFSNIKLCGPMLLSKMPIIRGQRNYMNRTLDQILRLGKAKSVVVKENLIMSVHGRKLKS
ncbi:hypothetical protein Fmac_032698 [Flemingia macrophylla]|uniref:Uncharacterized protein n=1 Tax=Flemingia macrophylla TaxID=520843 RepID=A0ABD1L5P4_9FABA